jgi:thiamine biosynthesis protein ThiI
MNVAIRYHEIALKGRNRPFFVRELAKNVARALSDLGTPKVRVLGGRLSLDMADDVPWEAVRDRLTRIFGIANFTPTLRGSRDLETLKGEVLAALGDRRAPTFQVRARRSDKKYPLKSSQLEYEVGGAIKAATGMRVSLDDADLTVHLEVLSDRILYAFEKVAGPGGFPVGGSGRVMALLSGGIDSPVAAWRMMRRGCRVQLVHFHSFPLLDRTTIDKTRELARRLAVWQYRSRLILVPFGATQQAIVAACPAPLRVVLYRRLMVRIAERLSARTGAKALVTGESVAQVASQTLDNLSVVDAAAHGMILRPLIGTDKEEITAEARRIGTFEVSTLPDQDCCQLFMPRSPATSAKLDEVLAAEQLIDVDDLVARAIQGAEMELYQFPVAKPEAEEA